MRSVPMIIARVCLVALVCVMPDPLPVSAAYEELGIENQSHTNIEFSVLRRLAEQGDANAQFLIGVQYDQGGMVQKNPAIAVDWYQRAANQGHAIAQSNLGVMYETGDGVALDEAMAAHWYRAAALQGNATAQFNLGNAYHQGRGVDRNMLKAEEWFRKAAAQGHAYAMFSLGVMCARGEGSTFAPIESYMWLNLALARDLDETTRFMADRYLLVLMMNLPPEDIETAQWMASRWHQSSAD